MQAEPNNWAAVWAAEYTVELRAIIGGVEYGMDAIYACSTHPAAFKSLAIGQAVSSTLELTLLPSGTITKAADIHLYVRLRSGDSVTDWVPQGVYYIDTREETDYGLLSLTAYDRMIFADVDYFADGVISGTWPKPAPEVVIAICSRLGINLDSRSALDDSIMVSAPIGLTMRDVLGCIAAAHGGNFVISSAGALRLLPLESIPETGGIPLNSEDVVLINQPVTVSKIVLAADDNVAYLAGDESGYTLDAYCPFASQELADKLLERLCTLRYMPIQVENVVFDPLLELGDAIEAGGHMSRVYSMDITYDILCTADISAPIDGEVEHEIPIVSSVEKLIKYTASQTKSEIMVKMDSIVLRVTDASGVTSEVKLTEAGKIDLTGYATFRGLLEGTTVIDGGCIKADSKIESPVIVGGTIYAGTPDNMLGYLKMVNDGLEVYNKDGLLKFRIGYTSSDLDYPYIQLGSGKDGSANSQGIVKKFVDGLWIGNGIAIDAGGYFSPQDGYNGIFVKFSDGKTYVVNGTNMMNIYTGDAIARFG